MALSADIARTDTIPTSGWSILIRLTVWSVVWTLSVVCVFRLRPRVAVPAVLTVAVLLRAAALAGPPTLSDDLYRYAWDGRVQAAGVDPYRYAPAAPELAGLREPWLWPDDARCAEIGRPPGCTLINRAEVRTIYPPLAQAWFATVYRLGGIDARHKAWQLAGLGVDVALVGLLVLVLRAGGRDPRWSALYALSPFPVVEVANNGHVDGLAALFVAGALLLAARRRPTWAGALLGAAGLVKLYPLLLVVGLAGVCARCRSAVLRGGSAAAAVMLIGYLPHMAAVGSKVLGYLPGYLREEQYDRGGRYLLAGLLGLPGGATAVLAAGGLVAVAGWVLLRRPPAPRAWVVLLGGLLLAATPVQPWYAIPLLAVAAAAAAPAWALVAAAGYPYFFAVILGSPHGVAIGRLSYGLALIGVALVATRAYRARSSGPHAVGASGAADGDAKSQAPSPPILDLRSSTAP